MGKMLSRIALLVVAIAVMAALIEWKKSQIRQARTAPVTTVLGELMEQGAPVVVQELRIKDFSKRRLVTLGSCGKKICFDASRDELRDLRVSTLIFDPKTGEEIGKVANISYQPSLGSGLYPVTLDIDKQFAGQADRPVALIETDRKKNALIVPTQAIIEIQGKTMVYIVTDDNETELVELKLGESNGHESIVESGLEDTAKVIVEGHSLVARFGKVNVLRTEAGE